jgi:hypothetical protein
MPETALMPQEQKSSVVEHIARDGKPIATIIRASYMPDKTTFVSPDEYYQQAGLVVCPAGGVIPRHAHLPIERHLKGTPETLLVRKGNVEIDLYDPERNLIGTWTLGQGDVVLLVSGGHGIRCLEDTVLMEIKQGPYTGLKEKERF